jgi:hypothetical protein
MPLTEADKLKVLAVHPMESLFVSDMSKMKVPPENPVTDWGVMESNGVSCVHAWAYAGTAENSKATTKDRIRNFSAINRKLVN